MPDRRSFPRTHALAATPATEAPRRFGLYALPLAALAILLLGGCAIEVDNDPGPDFAHRWPATATETCRREVIRIYEDRYKVAFDIPKLTTVGTAQTVLQPFTLSAHHGDRTDIDRRQVQCTVDAGTLTQISEVR